MLLHELRFIFVIILILNPYEHNFIDFLYFDPFKKKKYFRNNKWSKI